VAVSGGVKVDREKRTKKGETAEMGRRKGGRGGRRRKTMHPKYVFIVVR